MNPGEAILTLMAIAIAAGTLLTGLSLLIKHRQHMAGVGGKTGDLARTVALLTETLEQQHARQQTVLRRLDALEADRDTPHLALPDETADALHPVSPRTRVRG